METGILPKKGSLNAQHELFTDVFPFFVEKWREARYGQIWRDVSEYVGKVLQAIFGKK